MVECTALRTNVVNDENVLVFHNLSIDNIHAKDFASLPISALHAEAIRALAILRISLHSPFVGIIHDKIIVSDIE